MNKKENCPDDMLHRKTEILNSFASWFPESGDVVQAEQHNDEAAALYRQAKDIFTRFLLLSSSP